MTALKKYQRLEATALWRPAPGEQRREVIVSIGDATLVISDLKDQPLTHWSLAAVQRGTPNTAAVLYHPDGDPGETLELAESEAEMIRAIETLRSAIERARPHPGRLRLVSITASFLAVVGLAVFWVPGAMLRHTVSVVPDITRVEIGQDLLTRITRVSGPACAAPQAQDALRQLARRTDVRQIAILPAGVRHSLALPGGLIVLNRAVIEDHEDPDVAAGFVLRARAQSAITDPLEDLLRESGVMSSFRLLTTGALPDAVLDSYATMRLSVAPPPPGTDALLAQFAAVGIRSTPYAYARDITGETVLPLIEADPFAGQTAQPALNDRDWLVLQSICGA